MTFEELADKYCNGIRTEGLFYVNLPNKLWLIIEKSGRVELRLSWVDEVGVSMTIILGTKSYENIDKLLEGLKGE